jgi:hypothetical protein
MRKTLAIIHLIIALVSFNFCVLNIIINPTKTFFTVLLIVIICGITGSILIEEPVKEYNPEPINKWS